MKVLSIVDHLQHGGVQRMAVNIANALSAFDLESHLCTILGGGELDPLISPSVIKFPLSAKSLYQPLAAGKLINYCKENKFDIVHVHHRALFQGFKIKLGYKDGKIIWHDHYGRQNTRQRPWFIYYLMTRSVDGIISVSHSLQDWAVHSMNISGDRVKFIPNFIETPMKSVEQPQEILAGVPGERIVCVANFRPHKDHFTLVRGFDLILRKYPNAHLILVGKIEDDHYFRSVQNEINLLSLQENITYLGESMEVYSILSSVDIGVLSSSSEGLPLTLMEYGAMGLPVCCTNVGDCGWLIKNQERGLLVNPQSPIALADGLVSLLDDKLHSKMYADNLNQFVNEALNKKVVVEKIIEFYQEIMRLS